MKVKKGVSDKAASGQDPERRTFPVVEIAEDTKRDYPLGAFASQTLGTGNRRQHRPVGAGAAVQYLPQRSGWDAG